jgi:BirA family biotin operon repressor/biotin-[acetyl-CoA-carboxylase] ligase
VERVQFVVVGLGVNLNAAADDFPPDVAEVATSLMLARGTTVPRALFTAALFTRLEQWLDTWTDEGFGPVRLAWKKLSTILGQEVLVRSEQKELRGVAEDIDESGALILRVDGKLERILAGDVEQVRARKG